MDVIQWLFFKDEKEERQIAISFSDYFGDFDIRTSNFSLILRVFQSQDFHIQCQSYEIFYNLRPIEAVFSS